MVAATPAGLAWIASDGKYELPKHIRYLNRKLVDVAERRVKRLMVFMPPRHSKSTTTSHYFPAWYLATHPEHRVILASYEADFAASWGRKSRDVLTEWGPRLYGVRVRDDSSAANRWDLADHEGGMSTAGVGGPITGKGADIFIIDDPIKNEQEAQSEVHRQHMWDWFLSTAYTRLEPNAAMIITLTRWHEDDLAGRLLKHMSEGGEPWDIICFPAIAEETDVLGREPGDALWPERFDEKALGEKRRTMENAFWWSALYQQRPTPASGDIFQRAWFSHRYRTAPEHLHIFQSIDSAFQEGSSSDWSVIGTWGMSQTHCYKLSQWRGRVAYPQLITAIKDQAAQWGPEGILIENKASGQSAIQTLRQETSLPIIKVDPNGSKRFRAESGARTLEAGRVLLPEDAPWVADYIEEHIRFPRASHDDQVDETSQILTWWRRKDGYSVPTAISGDSTFPRIVPGSVDAPPPDESDTLAQRERDRQQQAEIDAALAVRSPAINNFLSRYGLGTGQEQ